MSPSSEIPTNAVAVYCASSLGKQKAFHNAAISLGRALASAKRPLVYGGGSQGIMGLVSGAVLEGGGKVTGVLPYAMVKAGGEGDKTASRSAVAFNEAGRENVENIIVNSMHDRKVEMAKRSQGFFGLPGGFGTFEEILEVTTWTQIGIHNKPVVLINVLGFWNPLRELIKNGIAEGFIQPVNEQLIVFVDGPESRDEHETFNWGEASLKALDGWEGSGIVPLFNWTETIEGKQIGTLGAS